MNQIPISTYYNLLLHDPESDIVRNAEKDFVRDDLHTDWLDFLAEQFLAQNLSEVWIRHARSKPEFQSVLSFHESIGLAIKVSHETHLREEMVRMFPKTEIGPVQITQRNISYWKLMTAAAVCLCLIIAGVLWKNGSEPPVLTQHQVPVLMIENFISAGLMEQQIATGIAQRVPVKLSAAADLRTLTAYAVNKATSRVGPFGQAQILGASHFVRGQVQDMGDEFRIEASLIDVATDQELWSAFYTVGNNAKALDDMQDSMSLSIADRLGVPVSPQARNRLMSDITADIEVLNLFLDGERQWAERTKESLSEAITYFRAALQLDSNASYIRGYLALAHATYAENGYGSDHWNAALREAWKALEADPFNAEGLLVLGDHAEQIEKDYPKAKQYFVKALELQPEDAKIHQAIAELYIRTGDLDKGRDHIIEARAIEPEHPSVRWVETRYLTAFGRLEDAKLAATDLRILYPEYPNIRNFDWQYYLTRGE
jgi:tetratricopeptide (TPR) repeat protein